MKTRRKLFIGVLVALVLPVAAFAYWTSTGSGTGSASVDNPTGSVALKATITGSLVPGGTTPVALTASNPTNSDVRLGTVKLTSVAVDAAHAGCSTADFTMADVAENTTVAKGASNAPLPAQGTLAMANTAANQDACKGATLTLTLSA